MAQYRLTRFIWRGFETFEEPLGLYESKELAESAIPFLHAERPESVFLYQPDGLRVGYYPSNRPSEDVSAQGFYFHRGYVV